MIMKTINSSNINIADGHTITIQYVKYRKKSVLH